MLFDCSTNNVGLHLKNIFASGELVKDSVTEKISATDSDGKNYLTQFYNLDTVISAGYRVDSSTSPTPSLVCGSENSLPCNTFARMEQKERMTQVERWLRLTERTRLPCNRADELQRLLQFMLKKARTRTSRTSVLTNYTTGG